MIPVILSGGSGTRMWPYSRSMHPKQFLKLTSDHTMIQETILRLNGMDKVTSPIVVCSDNHRFIAAEQLREIGVEPETILLEPIARNTAPAITLAALSAISQSDIDPILLVLPADHVVEDIDAFQKSIELARLAAKSGNLVTFGIVPKYPETGYGYIQAEGTNSSLTVKSFTEKPNETLAKQYIDSENYFWNSGMFVFKASRFLEVIAKTAPDILQACKNAIKSSSLDLDFTRVNKGEFQKCPSNSIDYAVMEPICANPSERSVTMIPLDAGWNDVGSWSSLWSVCDKNADGNALRGNVLTEDTKNCFIQSSNTLIATVGLRDTVIVQTDDAILVADKNKVQSVKSIVNQLSKTGRKEKDIHRKVYRPWGYYDSIDMGERFQVKRLVVKPGEKLSLQMHHHRAEHWVVVSGIAKVINDDKELLLKENQSTYIPIGAKHSLENPGDSPLEIIEVQSGGYLGEDDIIRFEDRYGRIKKE